MSAWVAFAAGLFVGGAVVLWGMGILLTGQATTYPPELAERFEGQAQAAREGRN